MYCALYTAIQGTVTGMHPHDTVSGKMIASGIPRTMRCAWLREVKNTAYYLRKEDVIAIKKILIPSHIPEKIVF